MKVSRFSHIKHLLLCVIFFAVSSQAFAAGLSPFKSGGTQLGDVYNNELLKHRFKWVNTGTSVVTKLKAETSCGCTTAVVSTSTVPAGGTVFVDIEADLEGKRGHIEKTIDVTFEYDGRRYTEEYRLGFDAMQNVLAHNNRQLGEKLFGPKCAKCHADPAKDKYGKELFSAVCGFCHGKNAQGAMASGFTRLSYLKNLDRARILRFINDGSEDGSMPGFAAGNGGPLTERQVESLMQFFENKRKEWTKLF